MAELSDFVEQYCPSCQDETDHRAGAGADAATCLGCGSHNPLRPENDRVDALMERVRQEDTASLTRLRAAAVPLY